MLPKTRRRGCGKVGIPRSGRDFQGRWKSPLLGFSTERLFHTRFPAATTCDDRCAVGSSRAEPAVCQFVDAFQLAINGPGQFERIQATLELHQLRQPAGLGCPERATRSNGVYGASYTRLNFDPTRVFFTIFTEGG